MNFDQWFRASAAYLNDQMSERVLTLEAQAERDEFESYYGMDGNCSCHISPPCSSCTHPGNPRNQNEDESCWTTRGAL